MHYVVYDHAQHVLIELGNYPTDTGPRDHRSNMRSWIDFRCEVSSAMILAVKRKCVRKDHDVLSSIP